MGRTIWVEYHVFRGCSEFTKAIANNIHAEITDYAGKPETISYKGNTLLITSDTREEKSND